MTNREATLAFFERINAHDVDGLAQLMSDDHVFIDAHGNEVHGREKMIAGWRGYFEWFPDYHIEVNDLFESADKSRSDGVSPDGETFALCGFAGASFKGKPDAIWRLPAAWKAIVKDGRMSLWQVFSDTKIPFEIIERNSTTE